MESIILNPFSVHFLPFSGFEMSVASLTDRVEGSTAIGSFIIVVGGGVG